MQFDVSDGDMIAIKTLKGEISMRARTTKDLAPKLVSIPHGWDQANANELTALEPRDPITGYTELKALLCKIRKV
jgi:anaerobic selenocysteine-containing dehydrogenase